LTTASVGGPDGHLGRTDFFPITLTVTSEIYTLSLHDALPISFVVPPERAFMTDYRPTRLSIDLTAFVAPGAALVGEVSVGRNASVWFNATVRGDMEPIAIGAESNVQDACVVHVDRGRPTRIGERVTLGHGAIVHASVVEDDVLVAMKAVVLSGCHIGRHCLVGAGAVF